MFETVKTPCYIVDEKKLRSNLEILKRVQEEADCKILLAQKAFSMFRVYPLIGEYLAGTTASGLYEARLGREEMGKENHVFAPAFRSEDMEELDELDRQKALYQLMSKLNEAEISIREEGTVSADDLEAELGV